MPGLCRPIADGGYGFDYRLAMGAPDFWVEALKRRDEDFDLPKMWHELTQRRPGEAVIGYCESHDQALVGDKTLIFRMADAAMYTHMSRGTHSDVVERAISLIKMIRLITLTLSGEGYLNFMGNEFGHPEWVDFPREGNGWSYHYARRQWSLADNELLRFGQVGAFDRDMLAFAAERGVMGARDTRNLWIDPERKLLAFRKGGLVFLFNFHPTCSPEDVYLPVLEAGDWRVCFSTDEAEYGGAARIDRSFVYTAKEGDPRGIGFLIYSPCRTAMVLERA
jgi:1,4-alpha-glucan branching enzyme